MPIFGAYISSNPKASSVSKAVVGHGPGWTACVQDTTQSLPTPAYSSCSSPRIQAYTDVALFIGWYTDWVSHSYDTCRIPQKGKRADSVVVLFRQSTAF